MKIIEIKALHNGAHRNQSWSNELSTIPEGWAVVDCETPNFPFGTPTIEEVTHYRDVAIEQEVVKTREIKSYDEDGNENISTEEYNEIEMVVGQEPYTVKFVTNWVAGEMPEAEPIAVEPSPEERILMLEEALAQTDAIAIELFEAQAAQEEVNAAQDNALIELYELIGG